MKKYISLILVLLLAGSILSACQNQPAAVTGSSAPAENKTIKIGASPSPHAEILEKVKPVIEAQGYTLEIIEFTDYKQPNYALADGSLDANYFQHVPYLRNMAENEKLDIASAGGIHYEPMGVFPGRTTSLANLQDGAKIAVPNDGTNEGRALWLLDSIGLITMKPDAGFECTILDIAENPRNFEIIEMEAAQIPRSLDSVDLGVINGNYALMAELNVTEHALAKEEADSRAAGTYVNVIAVRKGDENGEKATALLSALQSDEVKTFIEEKYKGAVIPRFGE